MDIVLEPCPENLGIDALVAFTNDELALIDTKAGAWLEANELPSGTSPFAAMVWARVRSTVRWEMIRIDPTYQTSSPHLIIQVWRFREKSTIESRQERTRELLTGPIKACLHDLRHFT